MSAAFIEGLEKNELAFIKSAPKSDLHNHAVLGSRVEVMEKWSGIKVPRPSENFETFAEFDSYIVDVLLKQFQFEKKESFEYAITSAILQAKEDGVKLLEFSVDGIFSKAYPDGAEGMAQFLKEAHLSNAPELDFRPIIGMPRDIPIQELEQWMIPCIDTGYFKGLDLYGSEDKQQLQVFMPLYKRARQKGLKLKAHIGEYGSAQLVRLAVDMLELNEVQHGISAASSTEVMRYLRDNEVRLNLCPTSNVALNRVKSLLVHPARLFYDAGIRISINSDDIMVFGKSVSEEYQALYQAGLFSAPELDYIRKDSLLH